jgi:hypothetical protein
MVMECFLDTWGQIIGWIVVLSRFRFVVVGLGILGCNLTYKSCTETFLQFYSALLQYITVNLFLLFNAILIFM